MNKINKAISFFKNLFAEVKYQDVYLEIFVDNKISTNKYVHFKYYIGADPKSLKERILFDLNETKYYDKENFYITILRGGEVILYKKEKKLVFDKYDYITLVLKD